MKKLNKVYYALKKYDKGFEVKYYNTLDMFELFYCNTYTYIDNCGPLCYSLNETKILIKNALKKNKNNI